LATLNLKLLTNWSEKEHRYQNDVQVIDPISKNL
jgi:hypothetical protein